MGIEDRDYYRKAISSPVGLMQMASVTTWLILINITAFILELVLTSAGARYYDRALGIDGWPPLVGLGHFSLGMVFVRGEFWRLLTFQFVHANLVHLAMNMLGLFFFGPMLEAYLGRRRFLALYFLSGFGGAVGYTLLWITGFLVASPWTPLVGASAGIFGILIAAAQIAPNTVVLIFGIIPMRLKTLAWVLMAISAYTVVQYGGNPILGGQHNAGGEAGHLGGAAVGFLLIHNPQLLRFADFSWAFRRRPPF